jgi:hypothetical protein
MSALSTSTHEQLEQKKKKKRKQRAPVLGSGVQRAGWGKHGQVGTMQVAQ